MHCSIAPGKVLLFGEHFVVMGEPALGVAVSLYVKSCVKPGSGLVYSDKLGLIDRDSIHYSPFRRILEIIHDRYGYNTPVDIHIESNLPLSSGMGSSAAVAVATTCSILNLIGVDHSKKDIWEIAHEAEKTVHFKPSGVDTTLSTYGGLMLYRKGEFKRLEMGLPEHVSLIIVNTRISRSTGEIVREVIELRKRLGNIGDYIYKAAGSIVERALDAIQRSDMGTLGELMLVNQGLLWAMGVSCRICDDIIHALIESGAIGAKISGAGRGGIIIGLVDKNKLHYIKEALGEKYEVYVAEPDYQGVRPVQH